MNSKASAKPKPVGHSPAKAVLHAKPLPKAIQPPTLPLESLAVKPAKPKKAKPVRDSFTMPKAEYAVLSDLKLRAIKLAHPAKKSELIRAGVSVLAALSDADFLAAIRGLPAIKTGRPSKSESA